MINNENDSQNVGLMFTHNGAEGTKRLIMSQKQQQQQLHPFHN